MMPACTTLDHTVNQIKLRCACGFLDAFNRKTPSVAYTPTIIMKYWDSYGRAGVPRPAGRPHDRQRINKEKDCTKDGQGHLQEAVRVFLSRFSAAYGDPGGQAAS